MVKCFEDIQNLIIKKTKRGACRGRAKRVPFTLDKKTERRLSLLPSVCPEMRNFIQDRGMQEFNPQEYCMYFEDLNLSMTMRLEKIPHFWTDTT